MGLCRVAQIKEIWQHLFLRGCGGGGVPCIGLFTRPILNRKQLGRLWFKYLKTHPVLHLDDVDFEEQEHIGSIFKHIGHRLEYPQIVFEKRLSVICCASYFTISGVSLTEQFCEEITVLKEMKQIYCSQPATGVVSASGWRRWFQRWSHQLGRNEEER